MRYPALLLASLFVLSACGGGGGGTHRADMPTTPPVMPPDMPPTQPPYGNTVPATAAALLASAGPSLYSVVPTSKVWFGSASLTAGPDVTDMRSSYDGQRAVVTIERGSADTVTLDTADATSSETFDYSVFDPNQRGLSANRMHKENYFFRGTGDAATYGRFVVDWSSSDPTDYVAGGYWLHAGATSTNWEGGAFAAGPELSLSDPATLPVSGTASYFGEGGGFVATNFDGNDSQNHVTGRGELSADFSAGTIGGRFIWSAGGAVNFGTVAFDRRDATFEGSNVTISAQTLGINQSSGKWGGQFSNIPDNSGAPRLAVTTFDATGSNDEGDTIAIVGVFGAGLE